MHLPARDTHAHAAADWRAQRATLVRGALPADVSSGLAATLEAAARIARRGDPLPGVYPRDEPEGTDRPDVLDGGGEYRHVQFDYSGVHTYAPALIGLYHGLALALEGIVGGPVVRSPWRRSSVNAKVLLDPGDGQGWHYDTNSLTALLYLTATTPDTGTLIKDPATGEALPVLADPGDLLVMDGRHLWHRIPAHPGGTRITCPLNYYLPGDLHRPDGIDRLVYGSDT